MTNKIVIYYSYTNHTRMIAKRISKELNCDIVELLPVTPYSNNYDEVVEDEQNQEGSNHIPEIKPITVDLAKYDEIILGTPVWWYRSAPVVRAFLERYDLSGKIIKPFATNAGWLGKTLKEIKTLAESKGATVKDEMNIVFTTNHKECKLITPEEELKDWINTL